MFGKGFLQEHRHFNLNIVAARRLTLAGLSAVLPKDGRENVVKIFGVITLAFALLELLVELRIVAVLPQLVVFGATLFITQHFPCFRHLFKAGFGIRLFADIRMVFAGQSAVGGLDSLEIVRRFHAHNGVIIL